MAFTSGSATDYHDLLTKLKDYLLLQGWTIQQYDIGATLADPSHLYVTGPGISGGQLTNITIETEANPATAAYAWKLCGHPDYESGLDFGAQANSSPAKFFCLWNNAMDYWFYVNDWRIIVIAKIGSYYMSMYAGFFLPYALPAEWPFPYYIGATYATLQPYNLDNASMRSFCDPGANAACYMMRDTLNWRNISNSSSAASEVDYFFARDGAITWPYRAFSLFDSNTRNDDLQWYMNDLRPPIGGAMPLWQVHIMDSLEYMNAGVLDGVFATGGFNRGPEQIVTVGGQDYRLFLNVGRSTPRHFFAVEES